MRLTSGVSPDLLTSPRSRLEFPTSIVQAYRSRQLLIGAAREISIHSAEMARLPRLEFPGAVYHVTARGNEQRPIFRDDLDRSEYLDRIAHYRERFRFQLLAYCLMTNHVHLAIRSGRFLFPGHGGASVLVHPVVQPTSRSGRASLSGPVQGVSGAGGSIPSCPDPVHPPESSPARVVIDASEYRGRATGPSATGAVPDGSISTSRFRDLGRPGDRRSGATSISSIGRTFIRRTRISERSIARVKGEEAFALERFEAGNQLEPPLRGLSEDRLIEVVAAIDGTDQART